MKTLYITLILLLGEVVLFAQDKNPLPDSTAKNLVAVSPINGLLPNVTPKSPNATALGRHDEHPVSMYTGLASIEIPIFEIEAGGIKVPVKLSYHAGGHKVSDIASWVGLGWSLQYGGTVSRSMQGIPDEKNTNGNKGFLFGSLAIDINANAGNPNCVAAYGNLGNFENNIYDNGADMFSYSHANGSGKFMFQANGQTIMMPDNRTKVSYTTAPLPLDDITAFKLIDESGFTHDYAYPELSEYVTGVGQTPVLFPTNWHISSITGTAPKDKVLFNYRAESFAHSLEDFSQRVTVVDSGGVSGTYTLPNPGSVASRSYNNVRYPTEIIFPTGKVVFVSENTSRTDIPYNSKALDKIEIYGYNVITNTYTLIRTADLYQSYVAGITPSQNTRMLLDSVVMKDNTGTKVSTYLCEYNTTIKLPNYQSFNKDLWGYYNGQNNADLIQQQQVNFNGGTNNLTIGSANRNVFPFYTQALMLKKMTFPTGGYSTFEYEANQYLVGSVLTNAGGLRIKQIVSYPSTTTTLGAMTKTYKYGVAENGAGRLGASWSNILTNQSLFKTSQNGVRFLSGRCNYTTYTARTYSSSPTVNLFPSDGSPVLYAEVTEYSDNGTSTNGTIGKTIHKFADTHTDNLVTVGTSGIFHTESYQWDRGQLLEKTSYGNDGKKKHKVLTTYDLVSNQSLTGIRKLIFRQIASVGSASAVTCVNGCGYPNEVGINGGFLIQTCNMPFGVSKPVKTEEFIYDNTDDTKFVKKTSLTNYESTNLMPRLSREIVNFGEIRGRKYFYPFDYQNIPATTTGELFAIRRLLEKNQINAPIEELSYLKSSLSATDSLISGAKLTSFFSREDNSSGSFKSLFVAPQNIYLLESQAFGAFGTTPYQSSSALYNASPSSYTSNVPKHGLYEQKLAMTSYDFYGNLESYTITNGRTDKFAYQDIPHDGLRLTYLYAQIQDDGIGTLNHSTFYNYTIPLLGLSSIQALNGTFTYFDYDSFGRLKNIKDHNNKVLKEYAYDFTNRKVTEWMPRVALNAVTATTATFDALKTVSFVDGLGRDLQKIIVKASPDSTKDIIGSSVVYDAFGRGYKSFLPSPSPSVGGALVSVSALQTASSTFYGDNNPFTETTVFDNSPLNRPLTNFGAGAAWRTANKSVSVQYKVAPANTIKHFKASSGAVFYNVEGSPTIPEYYGANELQQKITTTERGKIITEYIDLQGRTIQKEVEVSMDTILTTAYCFDLYDRLAYVIPPNAYKLFTSTRAFILDAESDSKEGLYIYKYDRKGQQIQKRIPGHTDFEVMVYDRLYRLVLNRDAGDDQVLDAFGRSRFKFQKYDAINRPVMSGLTFLTQGFDRQTIQTEFDIHTQTSESRIPFQGSGGLLGYTNLSFPVNYTPTDPNLRIVNYFDDYLWQTDNNYVFQAVNAYETRWANYYNGLNTGSLVRNIETLDWYRNVNYFDFKGQMIQSHAQNHLGGIDRMETKYSFTGEVLKMRTTHRKPSVADIVELYEYSYDHLGRRTKFRHSKDGATQNLSLFQYDAIGRLISKKIKPNEIVSTKQSGSWNSTTTWLSGSLPTLSDQVTINSGHTVTIFNGETASAGKLNDNAALSLQSTAKLNMGNYNGGNPLQIVDYSYHIRGGLRGINLDALGNPSLSGGKLFSMKLGYEDDGNYYDGNIRSQTWLSSIDNLSRSFTYRYDGASRIKAGVYSGGKPNENYALNNVTYDDNGNIKNLIRTGLKTNNTFGIVDNLAYTYQVNSNKIQKVDDISNETASFTDATGSTDYTYYADGSLKSDANKGISLIEYNYLKLPKRIVKGSSIILYEYNASGAKLKETIGTQVTDYVGNKIYKNNNLYQIVHGEGRIVNGIYEYDIKDHLGSLRVSFKDSVGIAKIVQANSYGIFGEDLQTLSYRNTPNVDNFKFTGKEDLPETGYTDFGARLYDKFVPRFTTIDPLAEISRRFSPYTYANDNPLRFIDPDGMRTQAIEQSNLEWGFSTLTHCDGCEFLGGGDKPKKKKEEKEKNTTIPTLPKPTTKDTDPVVAGGIALSGILLADDATVIGVADDPLIPVILAGTAVYAYLHTASDVQSTSSSSDFYYVTYTKTSPDGKVYVGRSSGNGDPISIVERRDKNHHMVGYGPAILSTFARATIGGGYDYRGLDPSYWSIRGSEQLQILYYRNLGISGNTINGIGPKNKYIDKYLEWGSKFVKKF
jgi:RHS repeat-associated protein